MNLRNLKKTLNSNIELVLKKLEIKYEIFNDNIYSTCPIHESSDNPRAFSFSLDKGIWKCWTRDCQQDYSNDIFGLIAGALSNKTGDAKDFKDALRWSCELLKIDKKYNSNNTDENEDQKDDFFDILKYLTKKQIIPQDKKIDLSLELSTPSDYFHGRGFNKATLKYFNVGDCYQQGIMKERSVIPIHNQDGSKVVGIIGRSIKEYKMPKFLIYPSGFNKSLYFYNYHRAIKKAKETSYLFIVEGQGDVWRMYEAGVKNVVSIFGKTISEQQVMQINNLPITNLVIIMDNDQSGREASVKIKRQFGRTHKLTFPKLTNKDVGDMSVKNIKNTILQDMKGAY